MAGITPRRPARTLGVLLTLVLVLLALLLLAWVADRVLHSRTEERLAAEVATALGTDREPEVSIEGGLFLPQVLSGSLDSVRAELPGESTVSTEAGDVLLRDVSAHARGVSVDEPHVVSALEVTGVLPDAGLTELARQRVPGVEVATSPGGIELTVPAVGAGLHATPEIDGEGVLAVQVTGATIGGITVDASDLATMLPAQARELMSVEVRAQEVGMPEGVRLDEADPADGGLRLRLTGEDVVLE